MGKGVALGLVLPMYERPDDAAKPTWAEISALARRGEELGVDTVWLADEAWRPWPRAWHTLLAASRFPRVYQARQRAPLLARHR